MLNSPLAQIQKLLFDLFWGLIYLITTVGSWIGSWFWRHQVVALVCLVLFFFFFTPYGMIPIVGLPLATFFFLWRGDYKDIVRLWSLFFFLWYFIFTALMFGFEGPLIFDAAKLGNGGCKPGVDCSESMPALLEYIFGYEDSIFGFFLFNSYGLMVVLSAAIGCPVYLPSVFKGIFAIIDFIAGLFGGRGSGPVRCAGSEGADPTGAGPTDDDLSRLEKFALKTFVASEKMKDSSSSSPIVSDEDPCKSIKEMMKANPEFQGSLKFAKYGSRVDGDYVSRYLDVQVASQKLWLCGTTRASRRVKEEHTKSPSPSTSSKPSSGSADPFWFF